MLNPWLSIPASDYEGHMAAVGQLAALGTVFRDVYVQTRPGRLAIVGCATGNGIEHVDPNVTSEVIGVDVNAEYLSRARARFGGRGFALTDAIRLHEPTAIEAHAERAGLFRTRSWSVALPNDTGFHVGLFGKKKPWR
jgi:SAM-dependent methyltransferase